MASSWQIGPVLRGIRGHRSAAVLVVVQFGIGLAITVLAVLIGDYFMNRKAVSPPVVEAELTLVELQLSGRMSAEDIVRRRAAMLDVIRAAPGCDGTAVVRELPLRMLEQDPDDVRREPGAPAVQAFAVEAGAGVAHVSGLRLRAGRDLTADDIHADVTAAIVSHALARTLWPDRDPVGAQFWSRSHGTAVVVGVAETMRSHLFGPGDANVIYARETAATRTVVLVRSASGQAAELRVALQTRLRLPGQHAVITAAADYARTMASPVGTVIGLLATTVGVVVLVVLIGSMGLTYFLVAKRTHEIAMRRALGATRRDVVRYFLLENVIFTVAGAVIGLAIVIAALPALFYEQEGFAVRWPLVAIAVATVVALNLIATLIPARKAAAVPPVVASRSV
ncbi:MAG TPA: FtsX-like permease family protein [Kofleriaceae bacterium]